MLTKELQEKLIIWLGEIQPIESVHEAYTTLWRNLQYILDGIDKTEYRELFRLIIAIQKGNKIPETFARQIFDAYLQSEGPCTDPDIVLVESLVTSCIKRKFNLVLFFILARRDGCTLEDLIDEPVEVVNKEPATIDLTQPTEQVPPEEVMMGNTKDTLPIDPGAITKEEPKESLW